MTNLQFTNAMPFEWGSSQYMESLLQSMLFLFTKVKFEPE